MRSKSTQPGESADSIPAIDTAAGGDTVPFSVPRAAISGLLAALMVGIPTDIIENPIFGREVPVRWWEYPVLALAAVLTALWFGIQVPSTARNSSMPAVSGATLAMFAVACPLCNKLVIAALGVSGALGVWAPLQPILAIASLALLTGAVVLRWRRRDCGPACARGPAM